jgi:hypothetical protein
VNFHVLPSTTGRTSRILAVDVQPLTRFDRFARAYSARYNDNDNSNRNRNRNRKSLLSLNTILLHKHPKLHGQRRSPRARPRQTYPLGDGPSRIIYPTALASYLSVARYMRYFLVWAKFALATRRIT